MKKVYTCFVLLGAILLLTITNSALADNMEMPLSTLGKVASVTSEKLEPDQPEIAACGFYGGNYGCWTGWMSCSGSCTRFYAPARAGYHAIQFYGSHEWGNVQPAWRSGSGAWSNFGFQYVISSSRYINLHSGSPEINYKFVFNSNGTGGTVYFRFFTD